MNNFKFWLHFLYQERCNKLTLRLGHLDNILPNLNIDSTIKGYLNEMNVNVYTNLLSDSIFGEMIKP